MWAGTSRLLRRNPIGLRNHLGTKGYYQLVLRSHWFSRAMLIGISILAVVIALNVIAICTGFQDADGLIDCWPYCSTWQHVVGWTLSVGALLFLVLVVAIIVRETSGRPR